MDVSVVVPVYDGEATLDALCERLRAVLAARAGAFEILLVDDGSRDASWPCIQALAARRPEVRGLRLRRNYGQHAALLCGVRAARHAVVVTLDDDLQNPPEEIPRLLERLGDDCDVVYGTPIDEQHGVLRTLASQVTKLVLQEAMGAHTARHIASFRAFRTDLRDAFAGYRASHVNLDVLLTWGTTRFAAVPVRHEPRAAGASSYTVWKLLTHAANMMTGFSTLPLQVASVLGLVLTLFGIGVLVLVVGRTVVQGVAVPGFAFLASMIAIFSGAQLFGIGVMGAYLARVHFRTLERPAYVVEEEAGAA